MNKGAKETTSALLFDLHGKPSPGQVFPLALQHVVAMIVGCVPPPLITGTVVFAIGLSLYPTAINYMAGGVGSPQYGSWQNWMVALITLVIVTGLNHYGTGIWKLFSILIGIIAGYGVWLCFGMVDFSAVSGASLFQLPRLLHFGTIFEPSACVAIGILFAINSIQAIGDFTAITTGGMDRMPTDEELNGGIVAYRFCNIISALFGGLPTAMFSQNVGIVSSTKVVAKRVFASIAMTGVKLIMAAPMDYRNTTIVGLFIAFRMGITQDSGALANFPAWVTTIFGKSPVVPAAITAITLNLALPGRKRELGVLKEGAAADAIVVEYIARILRYIYWLLYWPLTMQGAGFLS